MSRISTLKLKATKVPIKVSDEVAQQSTHRHSAVQRVGKFLYVIGSFSKRRKGELRTIPVVCVIDIRRPKLREIEYRGVKITQPKIFLYNDALYAYCRNDWSGDSTGKVSHFDLTLREWSYCNTAGNGPGGRNGCSGNYIEQHKRFVVFGGVAGRVYQNDVHMLAMPDRRWIKPNVKGTPPEKRYNHCSCVHEGAVFYYGGQRPNGLRTHGLFMLTISKMNTITWSSVRLRRTQEFERHSAAMISFQGRLLLCGGMSSHFLTNKKVSAYDFEAEEFQDVQLPYKVSTSFGSAAPAFTIEEGRTLGVFRGWYHNRTGNNYEFVCLSLRT